MRTGQGLLRGRAQMGLGREERAKPPHKRAPGWADGASPLCEDRGYVCLILKDLEPRVLHAHLLGLYNPRINRWSN